MIECEAVKILKEDSCYECSRGSIYGATNCGNPQCNVARATNLAINALEKQIAKKPVLVTRADGIIKFYPCPTCSTAENYECVYPKQKHCCNCGQKLDWSEV